MRPRDSPALRYHDGTKHHFNRFARSLGYLDWASQPAPFRTFHDTKRVPLFPSPTGTPHLSALLPPRISYADLFAEPSHATPLSAALIGDLLRHALGLSAWKSAGKARWPLRVNPSSGNLHPTEAYVICQGGAGLHDTPAVYHYASDLHALELRCAIDAEAWSRVVPSPLVLVGLSSIHWRESWKYGERAFRYCQHDLGHAIAALTFAARLFGWTARLLPSWSHAQVATLLGLDRDPDYFEAEREEPGCMLALCPTDTDIPDSVRSTGEQLASIAARGQWSGRASQLSEDHVEWAFIDEIAAATRDPGRVGFEWHCSAESARSDSPALGPAFEHADARALMLQRRSAVAFDGRSSIPAARFFDCLARLLPVAGVPWQTLWWPPRLHLLLFVHRVDGLEPGIYLLLREGESGERLRAAIKWEGLPDRVHPELPLVCFGRGDCRSIARRLSCDQDIAADGFFSLGMIADLTQSLERYGEPFYRQLFWESGVIGQVLYLDAEAAGARGTGIGCFYDDAVHDLLGLQGHAFQSLYHFTIGQPVEDRRLMVEPGYTWERQSSETGTV